MSTEIAVTREGKLKQLLDGSRAQIQMALPRHVSADRILRIALTCARTIPALLECTPESFLGAVIQASQLGLEPGSALGQCYLIPFNNNKTGKKEVQLIIGYQGMMDLVSRTAENPVCMPRAVYEEDHFEYEFGLNEKLIHQPANRHTDVKLTHVYVVVSFAGGRKIYDVMNRVEIDAVRGRSKAQSSGPWKTDFEAMAKKSILRRIFKYLPKSIELQRAVALDDLADLGESQRNEEIFVPSEAPVQTKAERVQSRMQDDDPESFGNFQP